MSFTLYTVEGTYENQCINLLVAYCGKFNGKLTVIKNSKQHVLRSEKDGFLSIPGDAFHTTEALDINQIEPNIRHLTFPVLVRTDKVPQSVYCGLCTVLRTVLKVFYEKLTCLLGHRLYCLKACAEVSSRTKLCETGVPKAFRTLCGGMTKIPQALTNLENLLEQPVVIHNMDKKQRVLLKKMHGNADSKENKAQKVTVWTKDLPQLEHTFLEGVNLHLSDLVVFPCVHMFVKFNPHLLDKLPLIMNWYNRMINLEDIKSAMLRCNVNLKLSNYIKLNNSSTEAIELKKDLNSTKKSKKKLLEQTLRRDLPNVLAKIQSFKINVVYQNENINSIDWENLPKEVHPVEGNLSTLRSQRKCQQIENVYNAVQSVVKDGSSIVDFCCGGGHLGIVLAYLLPNQHVTIIDNKEESLDGARKRSAALNLKNIVILQSNLEYFNNDFDIGVSLHACGVATDMVLHQCIRAKAHFALSPCCYGRIQQTNSIKYPQSVVFSNILNFDEILVVGRAADRTTWEFDSEKAKQGKHCMGIVDLDRLEFAKEHHYQTVLYSMQPRTCSPKNNLIFGKYVL